jgi:hypothetical protein
MEGAARNIATHSDGLFYRLHTLHIHPQNGVFSGLDCFADVFFGRPVVVSVNNSPF